MIGLDGHPRFFCSSCDLYFTDSIELYRHVKTRHDKEGGRLDRSGDLEPEMQSSYGLPRFIGVILTALAAFGIITAAALCLVEGRL